MFFNYLKDKKGFLFVYFINSFLITLFYQISTDHKISVVYPFLISIFVAFVYIVYNYCLYYMFNIKISKIKKGNIGKIDCYSNEHKNIVNAINNLDQSYICEINQKQSKYLQKNKFISQWIHNMKTPISVIDLVIQRVVTNEITFNECIKAIKIENTRLLNYLDQVLNMIRIDDFEKDYLPEKVNLLSLVTRVINERKNQFIYNGVFPKVLINKDIYIITDVKWTKNVIEQIVSNAIKYSSNLDRKGQVIFSCKKQNENNIILEIEDNGVGIPKEDLGRIFEPFFTGSNGRKHNNSSGIGLYIVKQIVEKLDQTISVNSLMNKGTRVSISYAMA